MDENNLNKHLITTVSISDTLDEDEDKQVDINNFHINRIQVNCENNFLEDKQFRLKNKTQQKQIKQLNQDRKSFFLNLHSKSILYDHHQSLQKQIHQFKEKQKDLQSNSSVSFENLGESEHLETCNYSLNSNSTLDTTATVDCSNASTSSSSRISISNNSDQMMNCADNFKQTMPLSSDKQDQTNLNNLYLFSCKRPKELKHYTHEIKFMKTPGFTLHTSILLLVGILVMIILFSLVLYIAVQVLDGRIPTERVFEGQMQMFKNNSKLVENNATDVELQNELDLISSDLKIKFNLLFNQSEFSSNFERVQINSIEQFINYANISNQTSYSEYNLNKSSRLFKVRFNMIFKVKQDVELTVSNVYLTILSEIIKLNQSLFSDYLIEQSSLLVQELNLKRAFKTIFYWINLLNMKHLSNKKFRKLNLNAINANNSTFKVNSTNSPDLIESSGQASKQHSITYKHEESLTKFVCEKNKIKLCDFLPYNLTLYPNLVKHINYQELELELIYFRQIIDSECFIYAKQYICMLLHPSCSKKSSFLPNYPCSTLCDQFVTSCLNWIPAQIKDKLSNCNQFINLTKTNSTKTNLTISTNSTNLTQSNQLNSNEFNNCFTLENLKSTSFQNKIFT